MQEIPSFSKFQKIYDLINATSKRIKFKKILSFVLFVKTFRSVNTKRHESLQSQLKVFYSYRPPICYFHSVHEIFLRVPLNVCQEVANYIVGIHY